MREKFADPNLIAKWKKPGYERLCCLMCIQQKNHNFNTTCICRVPKDKLEEGKLVDIIQVKTKSPLNERQNRDSIKFIKKYHKQITEKWHDFFVLHKSPKCRKITTKIK